MSTRTELRQLTSARAPTARPSPHPDPGPARAPPAAAHAPTSVCVLEGEERVLQGVVVHARRQVGVHLPRLREEALHAAPRDIITDTDLLGPILERRRRVLGDPPSLLLEQSEQSIDGRKSCSSKPSIADRPEQLE